MAFKMAELNNKCALYNTTTGRLTDFSRYRSNLTNMAAYRKYKLFSNIFDQFLIMLGIN